MPSKTNAVRILEQSQITGAKNVFILGCTDRRVTFNTQQTRAFNLVWALFENGVIKKKSKVALIGGGLSGMTAAAALNLKECKVTLYHEKDKLMNIQKGNYQRYIHPNIYDWPKPGCEINHTDFPCMNWSAATANRVFEQIEDRWEELSSGIEVLSPKRIDEVKTSGGKPRIYIKGPAYSKAFDCIIIAVGFGIEQVFPNTRYGSYWDPDDLDLTVKTKQSKHFLVSGCGDGGLIDALRIRVSDFNHEEFSKTLLQDPELEELKIILIEIEKNAPENEEDFATYIYDQYMDLNIPDSLLKNLSKRLRSDTTLELNGGQSTAMSPKACLINRFSVFLLIKLEAISYEQGKIQKVSNNGKEYVVSFTFEGVDKEKNYDEVVVRHGPSQVVEELIGSGAKLPEVAENEKITFKAWKDDFYPTRTEETNQMSEAAKHLEKFKLKIDKIDREATISIIKEEGQEVYMVSSEKYKHKELVAITFYKGIKVQLAPKIDFKMALSNYSLSPVEDMLSPGSRIFNQSGQSGTLGCFVQLVDQRTAFLSSAHLFKDADEKELYYFTKGNLKVKIGTLLRKTKLKPSTDSRRNKNIVDAALISIARNIPYSRSAMMSNGKKIIVQGIATSRIGDKVFKLGAGRVLTYGEVIATHCSIVLEKDNSKYYFEDAVMVNSLNNDEFASSGDSGAMVFREDGNILGMIFAVSRTSAILCPIEDILKELQCSLLIY